MIQVDRGTGSGFVIDREGRIVTNNHVVAEAANGSRIRVLFSDGRRHNAVLVGRSPSYDLAVIKVSGAGSLQPLELGDSDHVQIGEQVIAVGSPLGLPGTVTAGHHLGSEPASGGYGGAATPTRRPRTSMPFRQTPRSIQATPAALWLMRRAGDRGQLGDPDVWASRNIGLGFAIPINQAATIADLLIKNGKATYPVIGANVQDASSGVELTDVDAQGPAGKAGLRVSDVITDRRPASRYHGRTDRRSSAPGGRARLWSWTTPAGRRTAKPASPSVARRAEDGTPAARYQWLPSSCCCW